MVLRQILVAAVHAFENIPGILVKFDNHPLGVISTGLHNRLKIHYSAARRNLDRGLVDAEWVDVAQG